ncbi:uncharacterized protein J3D65DRAFT_126299 [Phyllosticta citribraziliensis]|uniref:Uncharacterized protein n=1 Tax=Phyllosticta citribraziliensis TaxID=989973 RepID=A0ABR1LCX9_9PEZI
MQSPDREQWIGVPLSCHGVSLSGTARKLWPPVKRDPGPPPSSSSRNLNQDSPLRTSSSDPVHYVHCLPTHRPADFWHAIGSSLTDLSWLSPLALLVLLAPLTDCLGSSPLPTAASEMVGWALRLLSRRQHQKWLAEHTWPLPSPPVINNSGSFAYATDYSSADWLFQKPSEALCHSDQVEREPCPSSEAGRELCVVESSLHLTCGIVSYVVVS